MVFLTGTPPFENVSSCHVSCLACTQAFSASESASAAAPVGGIETRAIDTLPMIAIRMLLKSCAMPPARSPSEASLPARARSSCALSASLMSRNATTIPIGCPAASRSGAEISSIGRSERSRAASTVQRATGALPASSRSAGKTLAQGCRVSGSKLRNTEAIGLPIASSSVQPVIRSAMLLIRRIVPPRSVVMTPSPMLRSVTVRRSVSAASACSARLAWSSASTASAWSRRVSSTWRC